jgi:spore germination cell wall hydrolase CwlJ-like protein
MKKVLIFGLGLLLLATAVFVVHMFLQKTKPAYRKMTDVECLARNLAFETLLDSHKRPEGRRELEAIIHVVLQRKKLGRKAGYRDTVCDVVYQHAQFSWTLKRKLRYKIPEDKVRWNYMQQVAREGLAGHFEYEWPEKNACIVTYKRADNKGVGKNPAIWFRARMRPVTVIEKHQFYCAKPKGKKSRSSPHKKRA